MRIAALLVLALPLCGCYTRTHITRTVKHPDGSTETYENHSDGYNYNPNFTGHADSNYQIRSNANSNQNFSAEVNPFAAPLSPNGQYSIR
jgi:hypothetical protein